DIDEAPLKAMSEASEAFAYQPADVSRAPDMEACIQAAQARFGGLDIAVLNAGIEGDVQPITDYDTDTFDRVMAVNVRGVWLGLKYC
ncbi:oxidoreductase, partial [Enterococcus hirae]